MGFKPQRGAVKLYSLQLMEHKWIQLPADAARALVDEHKKTNLDVERDLKPFNILDFTGKVRRVEFNVNAPSAFEGAANLHPMGGFLSMRKFIPGGNPEISIDQEMAFIKIGEDEKTFAAYA